MSSERQCRRSLAKAVSGEPILRRWRRTIELPDDPSALGELAVALMLLRGIVALTTAQARRWRDLVPRVNDKNMKKCEGAHHWPPDPRRIGLSRGYIDALATHREDEKVKSMGSGKEVSAPNMRDSVVTHH